MAKVTLLVEGEVNDKELELLEQVINKLANYFQVELKNVVPGKEKAK